MLLPNFDWVSLQKSFWKTTGGHAELKQQFSNATANQCRTPYFPLILHLSSYPHCKLLYEVYECLNKWPFGPTIVFIGFWNNWTEDNFHFPVFHVSAAAASGAYWLHAPASGRFIRPGWMLINDPLCVLHLFVFVAFTASDFVFRYH